MNVWRSAPVPATDVQHVERTVAMRDGSDQHVRATGLRRARNQRVPFQNRPRVEHSDAVRAVLAVKDDWSRKGRIATL